MTVVLRRSWTQGEFFAWAEAQEGRYEFDGFEPVAMTRGTANHSAITVDILTALRVRLRGTGCRPFGPDAGVETVGGAVRYPDALVTCAQVHGPGRTIPEVVVVFEVVSGRSGRLDRHGKVREYAAVPSIRRYVLVDSGGVGVMVLSRDAGDKPWVAAPPDGDAVSLPEVGIELPIEKIYEDVAFAGET